jgi:signal transduction histidine kinase
METASWAPTEESRSPTRSLPLERKLPLLILGVLAFVLTLSLGSSYYAVRRSAVLSASERLTSLSHVLSNSVQQMIGARMTAMARAAVDTSIIDAMRSPTRPLSDVAAAALMPMQGRSDRLTPPELWTKDGRVVGSVQLELPDDAHHVRDDIRRLATSKDSAFVSKLYLLDGRVSFWQGVPVRRYGESLGYIVQERRFGMTSPIFQQLRDLMGSDIDLYARGPVEDLWILLSGDPAAKPHTPRPYGDSVDIVDLDRRGPALASTVTVHGAPFSVAVVRRMSAILDRPLATIRVLAMISILLIVLGGLVAWGIGRQLVRPLVELTRAAEAIAEGEYSKRVETRGRDEIGRLGSSFNQMAAKVQESSNHSAEAVDQLTKTAATQQFLADASRVLAMSLSDQMLLADLARFCVPRIADYCSLHIADDDGSLRRVETTHHDPTKQEAVRRLVAQYQYRIDGPGEVPSVIRSQHPLIIPVLDLDAIKSASGNGQTAVLLDEIRPCSFMCVPLIARGRPLGAISFTMSDSGRVFSPLDLDLAMELARRTAMAVDNAQIYRRSLALRLEAEAASTAKSDFLAKMSHEIRTPINAMMGYAELLEMGISGPVSPGQAKQLSRIRASGEHLTSLVNEILDLAKIEAGRMGVEPTNGVASEAIEAALALVRPQAATKGVELSGRIEGEPRVEYIGDPQRVQQILANLLSNAVKFTPAGGTVSVRCGTDKRGDTDEELRDQDWARIVVEDTGVGIAENDLERVFDAFVQVDDGYTRAHGGTGLGLTISRGLAQVMGGDITVESTFGKGSRFSLWLPVVQFVHS